MRSLTTLFSGSYLNEVSLEGIYLRHEFTGFDQEVCTHNASNLLKNTCLMVLSCHLVSRKPAFKREYWDAENKLVGLLKSRG